MSEAGAPEGDRAAPGQEPGSTADSSGKQRKAFAVPSWFGAVAERVTRPIGALIGRKPPVHGGRDLLRQRRLAILTFLVCLATLAGSIAASTQMSGASTGSINARGAGIRAGGTGAHPSSPSPGNGRAGLNTGSPTPKTSSPVTNTSGPGAGLYSSFSCSASGSSATTRVTVTGLNSNGSGDDFAAIQNAIDIAGRQGGGIVALPAGTFVIDSHLALKDNVELTGVGPATVIKAGPGFLSRQGPGGGYSLISTAGSANTTIADLTADQSGDTLDANVPARLAGYVVEGYYSNNILVNGVYVRNPFTYSIAMVRSADFCIENCNVSVATAEHYNQLDGIHILDSNSGQVIGNTIQSGDDGLVVHSIGAPVYDVLFAHNNVFGGETDAGLKLAVGGFPIYAIAVEDNNFYGSLYGIRVGYYGDQIGSVSDISINANYIHNLAQGQQFPAIDMDGLGNADPITDVTVTGNQICQAGAIRLQPGPGNVVAKTTGC